MKKIIVLALVICFGINVGFADDSKKTPLNSELRSEIVKLLDAPEIDLLKEETIAVIKFILNADGELVILSVTSDNDQVDNYVKSKLNYQKVATKKYISGKIFVMPLKIMKPNS